MSGKWKAGDVAVVTGRWRLGEHHSERRAYRDCGMWTAIDDVTRDVADWEVSSVRRLVVIDPEDANSVNALARIVASLVEPGGFPTNLDLAEALREFADPKPPKPDEPTGLGAVVEDDRGVKWVRVEPHLDGAFAMQAWRSRVPQAEARITSWPNIPVARVLSEGVTA